MKFQLCNSMYIRKETIMHGHDRHNTTILSIIHTMSTTSFGQYYFWPSSGWIQLSEKTTQYNMIHYNHQCLCNRWLYCIILYIV